MSQKAPTRLRLLNNIVEALANETDHAAGMAAVLRLAREHFGASRAFVIAPSSKSAAKYSSLEDCAESVSPFLPQALSPGNRAHWAALAARGGSIFLSAKTAAQADAQFLKDLELDALLAAPLSAAGHPIGLMGLSDPTADAEDTELMTAIGFIVESAYQKHQAAVEQRALGARYNALVEAVPSGIGILNIRQGRIQNAFVNEAYAAILGDTPSAAAANFRHGPLHYVYEDDRNDFLQALQPLLAGKAERVQLSYRLKRADGSLHPVHEVFTAQPNGDRSQTVIIVSTDMTDAGQPSVEERYRLALEAASLSI